MKVEVFDAIVIGAGQAGGPLSTALGESGWKTALIEREHVGGTCVNVGCTPTKTMIASARVAHLLSRGADYGINIEKVDVDLNVVRNRKRSIVDLFRSGSEAGIIEAENVELIYGNASFRNSTTVAVDQPEGDERLLESSTIVINAGARPSVPEVPGLAESMPLDSTSIMELDSVPGRLLIVGAGPIGLEFGQMFQRFGSEVTLVERGTRLLAREDEDIAAAVTEILKEDGLQILFSAEVEELDSTRDSRVAVINVCGESWSVPYDQILLATGRTSNGDRLNLEAANVNVDDRGYIVVDDMLRTSVPGIYAVGDVNGGPAFTHIAYDDYRILRSNLIDGSQRTRAERPVPYTIFIDPQLGRIGMTEQEARHEGIDVIAFKLPMKNVARALEVDETRGLMKAVVDSSSGQILGASILGIEGGEIAGAVQLAMMGGLVYQDIRDGVFSHPTLIESLNNLFSSPVQP